jgi:hypothetical protein
VFLLATALAGGPALPSYADDIGIAPLLLSRGTEISDRLPPGVQLLKEPAAIEAFLEGLDGNPPDWPTVYGHGHHDAGHDDRLFQLNRDRDAARAGRDLLHRPIAFVWKGELSSYDSETGGFRVALGPLFTPTSWGMVRFKYEDLPGTLVALPMMEQRASLLALVGQGQRVAIDVIMIGTLVGEESIVYDFSHDQDGQGLVMPVVRIDRLLYLYSTSTAQ